MDPILIVLDTADQPQSALKKGMELASFSNSPIELVAFCFEKLPHELLQHTEMGSMDVQELVKAQRTQQANEALEDALKTYPQIQPEQVTTTVVWEHYLHRCLVQKVEDKDYSLVVKTGHRSESPFYTPSDWHLMRDLQAPLYLVNEHAWKAKPRILVCLDVISERRDKQALNIRLLNQGKQLADAVNGELACCFVVPIPRALQELDIIDTSSYTKLAREKYLPLVKTIVKPFGISESNIHRAVGEPVEQISKISRKIKSSATVIGDVGRKGVVGKLIGNTAEQLLKRLKTDMLVVNNQ